MPHPSSPVAGPDGDLPRLRRQLEVRERELGRDAADTLTAASELEACLKGLRRFEEALPLARRLYEASMALHGEESQHTAKTLANMAWVLNALGKSDEALPLIRRAHATIARVLGPEHRDTLRLLSTMACNWNMAKGTQPQQHSSEPPLTQRDVEAMERVLGLKDRYTLRATVVWAAYLGDKGRYEEAMPQLQRLLAAQEQAGGITDADMAAILSSLASMHMLQQLLDEATPLLRRALGIYMREAGADSPDAQRATHSLVDCLTGALTPGHFGAALPLLRSLLASEERRLGEEHATTLKTLALLAD